jgi:hypothetical protein
LYWVADTNLGIGCIISSSYRYQLSTTFSTTEGPRLNHNSICHISALTYLNLNALLQLKHNCFAFIILLFFALKTFGTVFLLLIFVDFVIFLATKFFPNTGLDSVVQWKLLNVITLGQRETENIIQMITLTKQALILVECKNAKLGFK